MYVNPFLFGVICTLLIECGAIIVVSFWKGRDTNGKDNNNQSNQQNQHKD